MFNGGDAAIAYLQDTRQTSVRDKLRFPGNRGLLCQIKAHKGNA